MHDADNFCTIVEAAALSGCGERSIRRWLAQGRIETVWGKSSQVNHRHGRRCRLLALEDLPRLEAMKSRHRRRKKQTQQAGEV